MGVVKVNPKKYIVHCDTLESGTKVFWADKTFRNIFERIAFKDENISEEK